MSRPCWFRRCADPVPVAPTGALPGIEGVSVTDRLPKEAPANPSAAAQSFSRRLLKRVMNIRAQFRDFTWNTHQPEIMKGSYLVPSFGPDLRGCQVSHFFREPDRSEALRAVRVIYAMWGPDPGRVRLDFHTARLHFLEPAKEQAPKRRLP